MDKEVIIIADPKSVGSGKDRWPARYTVHPGSVENRYISIESRSSIEVVVAKAKLPAYYGVDFYYYVSVPNFGVAIPGIDSLKETDWIAEKLMSHMPAADALTVAQVLWDVGDF